MSDFSAWHLEDFYPLSCVHPLVGGVQASLPYSSHCAACFLVMESSLLPASWGFEFPTFMALSHALAFLLNVTVVCWHLGCSLIFRVKHGDSSNSLLLGWRQNYLTKYSYSFVPLVFSGRSFILFSQLNFSSRILIQRSFDLRFSEFEIFFPWCYIVLTTIS